MASGGHGESMLRQVLIGFAAAVVIILIIVWLVTGGVGKTIEVAQNIFKPFTSLVSGGPSEGFRLPWQPTVVVQGPALPNDPVDAGASDTGGGEVQDPASDLSAAQREYDALQAQINEAKTFGNPSPYRGQVFIVQGGGPAKSGANEYVGIQAEQGNATPVDITAWSLQSALTGIRAFIPRGVDTFMLGAVNAQVDIYLNPGASALLSSGSSPVGTSFRENLCTGYLGSMQTFSPPLAARCPSPSETLPETPDNLRTYGDECFNYVQQLSSCTFPLSPPRSVYPACRIFIANHLSYNGCVQDNKYKTGFAQNSWRIYLGAGGELWRNTHDIVRLLDKEGRTVDVIMY